MKVTPMRQAPGAKIYNLDPTELIPTHLVERAGQKYVLVHATLLTITTVDRSGTGGPEAGQLGITIMDPRDGHIGVALMATLGPDAADQLGDSLKRMAEAQRAGARLAANAALRKAAGK